MLKIIVFIRIKSDSKKNNSKLSYPKIKYYLISQICEIHIRPLDYWKYLNIYCYNN